MAQQTAQSQWEAEMAMRQAEQDESTRRWNYTNTPQNIGVGLGAGATPQYAPSNVQPEAAIEYSPRIDTIVRGLEQARAYGATAEDTVNRVYTQLQAGQITEAEARAILLRFGFNL